MKKKGIAASAFLAAAFAQSSVAVYGIVDVGLSRERGGTAFVGKLTGGVASGSRLGFRGSEISAVEQVRSSCPRQASTPIRGASGQGGVLFGRQAFVGLGSKRLGTVTAGRQYST